MPVIQEVVHEVPRYHMEYVEKVREMRWAENGQAPVVANPLPCRTTNNANVAHKQWSPKSAATAAAMAAASIAASAAASDSGSLGSPRTASPFRTSIAAAAASAAAAATAAKALHRSLVGHSPIPQRPPSPIARVGHSPQKHRSPSPMAQRPVSPMLQRSPSPIVQRSLSITPVPSMPLAAPTIHVAAAMMPSEPVLAGGRCHSPIRMAASPLAMSSSHGSMPTHQQQPRSSSVGRPPSRRAARQDLAPQQSFSFTGSFATGSTAPTATMQQPQSAHPNQQGLDSSAVVHAGNHMPGLAGSIGMQRWSKMPLIEASVGHANEGDEFHSEPTLPGEPVHLPHATNGATPDSGAGPPAAVEP